MFDSEITASVIISQIKNEADIALPIDDNMYIKWINDTVRLLYTDIIKEQGNIQAQSTLPITNNKIAISSLVVGNDEEAIRFEDIYTIYIRYTNSDGEQRSRQLIRSTPSSGVIFPDTYYDNYGDIGLNLDLPQGTSVTVDIMYFVKPKDVSKTGTTISGNVMIPYEFIDLIKAKLRGEAYKLVNEDILSAKWLNDYNSILEAFKVWIAQRNQTLGM